MITKKALLTDEAGAAAYLGNWPGIKEDFFLQFICVGGKNPLINNTERKFNVFQEEHSVEPLKVTLRKTGGGGD